MNRWIIFGVLTIWVFNCFGQFKPDSTYTYTELNTLLQEARRNYISKENKTVEDDRMMANLYFVLAESEEERLNHKMSFEYYTNSLSYYKKTRDTAQVYEIQRKIAERYKDAGMYEESLELYQELLDFYQSKEDLASTAYILSDMAKVHKERGVSDEEQEYINRAIALNRIIKDTSLQISFIIDKVNNYERLNEVDSALLYAFKAFRLSNEIKDDQKLSKSLFLIGYYNKLKTDYDKAIKYLLKSEEVYEGDELSKDRLAIYQHLSDAYSKIDEHANALMYASKYSDLNTAILKNAIAEATDNAAIKYETSQTKYENELLARDIASNAQRDVIQKRALYILTGGLTLLLLLIYYLVRFYTQKIRTEKIINTQNEEINNQKIRELEDNLKISSMQSMIEGQEIERERIAKDLHDSLGGLLSTIKLHFDSVSVKAKNGHVDSLKAYNNAHSLLDTAVEEVRTISHNLQPGSLKNLGLVPAIKDLINRFDGENYPDIDFQHYMIPDKMDKITTLSIYRIVQELFHNAIKHAKASEVLLQINQQDDELVIQFEDDGIGFDRDTLSGSGMGLENITSRINYLKGDISIDSRPGEGTSYLIHLKYK
jgi:signal transduction histidine kinase